MAIFFATYRTIEPFFPLLFILKKTFLPGMPQYIWIFIIFCSLQTVKKNPLSLIQFWRKGCVTYRTLFCNAFFPKHIYLFTAKKTYIHTSNLWCLSFFLVHLLPKNMCLQFVWHLFLELEYSKNVTYRTLPTGQKCNSW